MYEEITDVNPGEFANEINGVKYYNPMMIYPAIHYTMGGIWVDYELQTSITGLFAIGECNFSDHGANRLGASALMQGLADGYFVLPYTIQNYLADQAIWPHLSVDLPEFAEAEKGVQAEIDRLMNIKGKRSVDSIHKELGHILLIAGQDDPVGDMGAGVRRTHDAFKRAGVRDVTLKLYPGLRHEILNEAAMRDTVYGDIGAWLDRVLG